MKLFFTIAFFVALTINPLPLLAQQVGGETEEQILEFNKKTYAKKPMVDGRTDFKGGTGIPAAPKKQPEKNMMMPPLSAEAKMRAMQTMMLANPFDLRHMINMMVAKKKVAPGVSFDEVIESIKLKANELNMTATGHNTPYLVLRNTHDPKSPRVEILGFCDLVTMRMIIDYSLEFIAFLPCRVAVVEDAKGDIWIATLDWDIRWLDTSPNPNRISDELRQRAIKVRENIEEIMDAAARGDF